MIKASDLIKQFEYALNNAWGYIWGTAGENWTAAKQAAIEKTTDADRAQARKYGSKWIGHTVADCSGLFKWAFKKLGGDMYHGSDTMYRKWCVNKGELRKGKRADGKQLLPGTALFVWNGTKYSHVGLYIGNNVVIEACSTIQGVITNKATATKWSHWGELKGVEYDKEPDPKPAKGYAKVTGKKVALRAEASTRASVIMRINTGEIVKMLDDPKLWDYVEYNGKRGWMMREFLEEGE